MGPTTMTDLRALLAFWLLFPLSATTVFSQERSAAWNQWRGPNRDGHFQGAAWPNTLDESSLKLRWRKELPESYSGPVVSEKLVFTTGTESKKDEVVVAFDRAAGEERWRVTWPGAISVPFFAASNGSWIRATPAFDGETLYVAGMRDVLVALDGETGREKWRVDFVERVKSPPPAFGFASSPLVDGEFVYVQAGAGFAKLKKANGEIVWRTLDDGGGMNGSAFSSPIFATLAGRRQFLVQTREKLCGVSAEDGAVLWEQKVPHFRGMNILTPIPFGDAIFTSSYQNKAWLYSATLSNDKFEIKESWNNNAQAYMSTPVVIGDHAYVHLQNQRYTCINLKTGERTWTSKAYGKYASLVANGDLILSLDQRGELLLIKANPKEFEVISERKVSDEETWAHVAVDGDQVFVRELKGLSVFKWGSGK
jgi:outer membrane protein assembly factor BamB